MKPARKPQTSAAPKVKRQSREDQNQEARDRKRDKSVADMRQAAARTPLRSKTAKEMLTRKRPAYRQ